MRRAIALLAVAGVIVTGTALPAAADQPVEFSFTVTVDDTDPCTGEAITAVLEFNIKAHDHANTVLWVIDSHSETSNGYVGEGHETQVRNQNHLISVFNWHSVNDATGARVKTKGRFFLELDTGEVRHASFERTCVGRPA